MNFACRSFNAGESRDAGLRTQEREDQFHGQKIPTRNDPSDAIHQTHPLEIKSGIMQVYVT